MHPSQPRSGPERRLPASASSGQRGEHLAAEFLARAGFVIVARNLRTTHGEIDLLVRKGRDWAAVEVKARRDHPAPERCISPAQLDRLAAALRALAPELAPRPRSLRIDAVAIRWLADGPDLLHFPNLRSVLPGPHATGLRRRPLA
ncbi:MAG: YraN family protein [Planctomycetes bacterium]|nr:YraN family protein [Planctomycetota bacterium]